MSDPTASAPSPSQAPKSSERPLAGRVALVAGATRGAGRGIAVALGEAGATVWCTGRSTSRQVPVKGARPETIEQTAELVTAAGGSGVARRVDHTIPGDVEALVAEIVARHGHIDVLVNDIWGGDELCPWKPFWQLDPLAAKTLLERSIWTHVVTSRFAVPSMVARGAGLIVEITDGDFLGYRGQHHYDLVKSSVIRLAYGMSLELAGSGVTALAVTPGFLRSEAMLDLFGVSEANWRDGVTKDQHFIASETPAFVGRAVASLAADPDVGRKAGRAWASWTLAREYGFVDADGARPDWGVYLDGVIAELIARGRAAAESDKSASDGGATAESDKIAPLSDEDRFLLRVRLNQLDFDPTQAEQRAAIAAVLATMK